MWRRAARALPQLTRAMGGAPRVETVPATAAAAWYAAWLREGPRAADAALVERLLCALAAESARDEAEALLAAATAGWDSGAPPPPLRRWRSLVVEAGAQPGTAAAPPSPPRSDFFLAGEAGEAALSTDALAAAALGTADAAAVAALCAAVAAEGPSGPRRWDAYLSAGACP